MAKSKTRRKTRKESGGEIDWGGMSGKPTRRGNIILAVLAATALAAVAFFFWRENRAANAFNALAAQGQAALSRVVTPASAGGGHLPRGQAVSYPDRFPTSGIHNQSAIAPGFYDNILAPTMLVHSLEHGHVVVYYDDPGAEGVRLLRDWTSAYGGPWDGVLAVPAPGLGKRIVLTAWLKRLSLDTFEPAAAAAFIDAYRGRGPENPVR